MAKYVLIKNNKIINTVLADENWAPPEGFTKELFDPSLHTSEPEAPTPITLDSWSFLSLFTEQEIFRYHSILNDTTNSFYTDIFRLREMLLLNAGQKLEGTHPVLQAGLYILRGSGIIESDERLTEIGNFLQGI